MYELLFFALYSIFEILFCANPCRLLCFISLECFSLFIQRVHFMIYSFSYLLTFMLFPCVHVTNNTDKNTPACISLCMRVFLNCTTGLTRPECTFSILLSLDKFIAKKCYTNFHYHQLSGTDPGSGNHPVTPYPHQYLIVSEFYNL